MKKDESIRVFISAELKQKFVEACDGRPMSAVVVKLIENYIIQKGGSSNET